MRLTTLKFLLIISVISTFLNSCGNVNSNALFKIPKDGSFKYDSLVMNPTDDYILGPGDRFSFQFATNDGERIIFTQSGVSELAEGSIRQNQQRNLIDYLVRQDGSEYCARITGIPVTPTSRPMACAFWNVRRKECTIVTPLVTGFNYVGHELRHCFEGAFHD